MLVAALDAGERAAGASRSRWPDPAAWPWIRRAVHDTTLHRVDAELARPAPVVPIAPDQALDGIDEILAAWPARRSRGPGLTAALPGRAQPPVLVATADRGWLVRVTPGGVAVADASPAAQAAATIRGDPQAVLLWLWRRGAGHRVHQSGDATASTELAELLHRATLCDLLRARDPGQSAPLLKVKKSWCTTRWSGVRWTRSALASNSAFAHQTWLAISTPRGASRAVSLPGVVCQGCHARGCRLG
jgi:hypothetical protein